MSAPSQNRQVLYLSYDGMTDPLGQSQVIPYLQGLTAAGWQITLVSFEKKERADKAPEIATRLQASGINWQPLAYTRQPPVLSTLFDIWRLKRHVRKLHRQHNFALVHCRGYITALAGQWLKKRLGVKFVFDMRGFFADERVDGGLWNLKNPVFRAIYNFFKKKEQAFFSQADHSICLTYNGREIIHSWPHLAGQPVPVTVIPCCADLQLFDPGQADPARALALSQQLYLPTRAKVLAYLGSIGTWYMLPEMLAFFGRLLQHHPDFVLLFITAEPPEQIMAEARKQGVPSESLRITRAERAEVPLLLSLACASLFFIKPVFSKQASSPTKQGELMAMGIPVICNSGVGDTDYVVKKYGSGLLVNEMNHNGYEQAIAQLPRLWQTDPASIRAGAEDFYSLQKGVGRYLQVYHSVTQSREQTATTSTT